MQKSLEVSNKKLNFAADFGVNRGLIRGKVAK